MSDGKYDKFGFLTPILPFEYLIKNLRLPVILGRKPAVLLLDLTK
jgi:hypothetical protein